MDVQALPTPFVVVSRFFEKLSVLDRAPKARAPNLEKHTFFAFLGALFGAQKSVIFRGPDPPQEKGGGSRQLFRSGYISGYTFPEDISREGWGAKVGVLISPVFYKENAFLREKCTSLILFYTSKYHTLKRSLFSRD